MDVSVFGIEDAGLDGMARRRSRSFSAEKGDRGQSVVPY